MTPGSRLGVGLPVAISFAVVGWAVPAATWFSTASLSLACGVSALTLMASASLLGARWRWIEDLFGGLDRVYQVHKWLGIWALVMASVHLSFKAGMPPWDAEAIVPMPAGVARMVRQLGFVALMVIVMLALNRKIPYSTWRWWHKLSGPFFLIAIAHWISIKSPVVLASPAGWWLAGMSTLGTAAAAWKLLLYRWLSPHAEYQVVAIDHGPEAARLELLPTGRAIAFQPGQFGFLSLQAEGLREPHPFTLAGAPAADGRVFFMIRSLGDYTRKLLADIRLGMRAAIFAPFGRFERRSGSSREIWIAGGIGISPFLAWMDDPDAAGFEHVTLFYFHTPGRGFPRPDELAALARARGVELVCESAGPSSQAFADKLEELVRAGGARQITVEICGPSGLLSACTARLRGLGVLPSQVRFEIFELR